MTRIRRALALAALALACPPATAQAAPPACTFDPATRTATIDDRGTGAIRIDIAAAADQIDLGERDGGGFRSGTTSRCSTPGLEAVAVDGAPGLGVVLGVYAATGGSAEADGTADIEVTISEAAVATVSAFHPTPALTAGRTGDRLGISVNATGGDADADVVVERCGACRAELVLGQPGSTTPGSGSLAGGRGTGGPAAGTVIGFDGPDRLEAGAAGSTLIGGAGDDVLAASDAALTDVACGAGADRGDADAVDTLADCEFTAPRVALQPAAVTEGGTAQVVAAISPAPRRAATLVLVPGGAGDATPGTHAPAGSIHAPVAAGATSARFDVPTTQDALDEAAEPLELVVGSTTEIAGGTGTLRIDDDDVAPLLSVQGAAGPEGSEVRPALVLDAPSGRTLRIPLRTEALGARPGADFAAPPAEVVVPAGQTRLEVPIALLDDADDEADETFALSVDRPEHVRIGTGGAQVRITDTDDPPVVRALDARVTEGEVAEVVLELSGASFATQAVTVSAPGLGAVRASFPAGERTATVAFSRPVPFDARPEPEERVALALSQPTDGVRLGAAGTLTIVDVAAARPGTAGTSTGASGGARPGLCGGVAVTLLDVVRDGRAVRIGGIARQDLSGRPVRLVSGGRTIGRSQVDAAGGFGFVVRAPSTRRAGTTTYTAVIGEARSRAFRLDRRLVLTGRRQVGARARVTGRVAGARRPRTIEVRRVSTCSGTSTRQTVRLNRDGTFSVLLDGPAAGEPYVLYRIVAPLGRSRTFSVQVRVAGAGDGDRGVRR